MQSVESRIFRRNWHKYEYEEKLRDSVPVIKKEIKREVAANNDVPLVDLSRSPQAVFITQLYSVCQNTETVITLEVLKYLKS